MRVGAQVAAEAFRIISEGLSNVLRHTAARKAFVRVHARDGWLQLAIGNESGPSGGSPRSFTPRSINERALSLGGTSFVGKQRRRAYYRSREHSHVRDRAEQ
jgi:signal transduction histidine kinase